MNIAESKTIVCPKCKNTASEGMQFCPHCGHKLEVGISGNEQDLEKPLGCFAYTVIGIISPLLPVVIIYLLASSNIFTENALTTIAALLSISIYPTIWYFAAKGWYNKVDFYGYVNVLLLSFVPLANWWVVYYLGKGLYMTYTKQEMRNPPKASKAGFIILLVILGLFIVTSVFSSPRSQFSLLPASTKQATFTPRPTQRPATRIPTIKPQLSYNDILCISWTNIDKTDLDSQICVYGKVYNYGPYSNNWTYIQFSEKLDAFRVTDFNYSYYSPLNIGDCVIVYGKIRDYGPYLIITPDKDAEGSVRVGSSSLCD